MRLSILTAALLASVFSVAHAADVAPAVLKGTGPAASSNSSACTTTACTGWYIGGNLMGAGTSSNVATNGINVQSLTAGGLIGASFGWQLWNGTLFAAVDITADYDSNGTSGGRAGYFFSEMFRAGGALQLPAGQGSPSQGPLQIGNLTALTPFVQAGPVQRQFANGWGAGVGSEFALGGPWMASLDWIHATYNTTVNPGLTINSEDLFKLSILRKF